MTKSFDDVLDGSVKFGDSQRVCFEKGFEAGQKSKQDGIDHLQKRIDDLKSFCIKGVESNMLSIEYNQALIDMHKILKGDSHES